MTQQFIVRVSCAKAGRYRLREMEYRVIATSPSVATAKAWRMYKRDVVPPRTRTDHFQFYAFKA